MKRFLFLTCGAALVIIAGGLLLSFCYLIFSFGGSGNYDDRHRLGNAFVNHPFIARRSGS